MGVEWGSHPPRIATRNESEAWTSRSSGWPDLTRPAAALRTIAVQAPHVAHRVGHVGALRRVLAHRQGAVILCGDRLEADQGVERDHAVILDVHLYVRSDEIARVARSGGEASPGADDRRRFQSFARPGIAGIERCSLSIRSMNRSESARPRPSGSNVVACSGALERDGIPDHHNIGCRPRRRRGTRPN